MLASRCRLLLPDVLLNASRNSLSLDQDVDISARQEPEALKGAIMMESKTRSQPRDDAALEEHERRLLNFTSFSLLTR
jgi:hypothetical protein